MTEDESQVVSEGDRRGGRIKKRIAVALIAVAAGLVLGTGFFCIAAHMEKNIYPNVCIDGINVGGMDKETALKYVGNVIEERYAEKTLTVSLPDYSIKISAEEAGAGIYLQSAVSSAYEYGRGGNIFTGAFRYFKSLLFKEEIDSDFYIDNKYIAGVVAEAAEDTDIEKREYSYEVLDDKLQIVKGVTGSHINQDELCGLISAAMENMDFAPIEYNPAAEKPADVDVDKIYREVYVEAADAKYDDETNTIVEHVVGISFDVQSAKQAVLTAGEGETVAADLIKTMPEIDTDTLSALLFRDVLAESTTYLSSNKNRTSNVRLAAGTLDGTIVGAGKVFSLNEIVGKRTAERGYLYAPAYFMGAVVDEIGGGVCQVSSTVYLTALKANMEIAERTNHSFIVYYVPYGQDATVSWGGPDFKFSNNSGYPIKIEAEQKGSSLTVRILGTKTNDNTVKMTYTILSTTPYNTVNEDDPTLPAGTTKVKTTGSTGYVVETRRNVYDGDGNLISSTFEAKSTYRKRDEVILVGTMAEAVNPEVSETPEEPETSEESETSEEPETAGEPAI